MVYCTKCGTKNPDDAEVCAQCGAPLRAVQKREECFGVERQKRYEEECFGIPHGGAIVTLIIGLIIILAGVSFFFSEVYHVSIPWWPFIVIIFGILIIIGAIYGLRRRY